MRIMLAMPAYGCIHPQTVVALVQTTNLLLRHKIEFQLDMQFGQSLVHVARTRAAHNFLKSDCTHLFWIDSDIIWSAEDFVRMCAMSEKMDIIAASYPYKQEPLIFHINVDDVNAMITSNEFGCIPVNSAGLGFCIVTRKIMEELAAKAPVITINHNPEKIAAIFRCDIHNGELRGEDVAFFDDVRDLGHTVWLDPTVTLGHIGPKEYKGALSDHLQKAAVAA